MPDTISTMLRAGLSPEAAAAARVGRTPLTEIAREDLPRSAPFLLRVEPVVEGEDPGDGLTLDGVGAVFNSVTTVDSWEGTFEELLAPGAFKRTLRETRPKMQFDHGMHPVVGSIPIGTFEDGYPREEDDGLHVRGRLHDNWLTIPVRDAIHSGAVDGMSFRFSIVNETWHSSEGRTATNHGKKVTDRDEILEKIFYPPEDGLMRRVLKEVKLREVGPVVWPQYTDTSVSVRSRVTIDLADPVSLAEPEMQAFLGRAVWMTDRARIEEFFSRHTRPGEDTDGPQSSDAPDVHPAPAETTEEVRSTEEAAGSEVSDQSPGEHPTDTTPDPERARRVAAMFARWDQVTTGSENTRSLINDFHTTGEDYA